MDSTYYPEGEKLPSKSEMPCDICFCIRGERKCTPKKCAPYIGNCKPKIPEGQCCPANYECGKKINQSIKIEMFSVFFCSLDHSDDTSFGSSHKPRQFDLFSYFFSDENAENDTSKEPEPQPNSPAQDFSSPISSTSEKSFFDAIREGLNYIDSNDQHVEKILDSPGVNTTTIMDRPLQRNTTQLSFLDILLSDDDDDDENENSEEPLSHSEAVPNYSDLSNFSRPVDDAAVYISDSSTSELNHDRYALLDEQTTYETTTIPAFIVNSVKHIESSSPTKTSSYDRSATERIISQYITYTAVPSYNFETSTLSTNQDTDTSTLTEPTTQDQVSFTPPKYETINIFDEGNSTGWSTSNPTHDDNIFVETTSTETEAITRLQTTNNFYDKNETDQITTTEPSIVSTFFEEFSNIFGDKNSLKERDGVNSRPQTTQDQTSTFKSEIVNIGGPTSTQSPSTPKPTRRVYPTIISSPAYPYVTPSIVKASTPVIVTVTYPTIKTTSKSTPTTKVTSNSTPTTSTAPSTTPSKSPSVDQLNTSTTKRPTTTSIPITTLPPSTTLSQPASPKVQTTYSIVAKEHPSTTITTTSQPSLIDSNPSILDSDLNYDYGDQPTLPPSLPNLKIIPFLPTDAVRKDSVNVHPKLEYYSTISTSYPILTENYENPYLTSDNLQNQNTDFTAFEVDESDAKDTFNHNNDNTDFNSYSVESTGYSNDAIFGIPNTNLKSPDYSQYPSITEKPNVEQAIISKYPAYSKYNDYDYESFDSGKRLDTNNKYAPGSYEVIDGHEYSVQSRNPSFDKFPTEYPERHVHSKIEYSTNSALYGYNGNNKFSPPSKTEGMTNYSTQKGHLLT